MRLTWRGKRMPDARWLAIALALEFVVALPALATSDSTALGDDLATAYEYQRYHPGSAAFMESPVSETPRYRVMRLTFPSRVRTSSPNNDLVRGSYYHPKVETRVPAVVVLHGFGGIVSAGLAEGVCKALVEDGIAAFQLQLPYHLERHAEGQVGGRGFITADPQRLVESGRQSVIDLRCVLDWLAARPDVDPRRLGVVGISLGAILAHLAMGVDDRLVAGVAILGGGDLAEVVWRSPLILPWSSKMRRAGHSQQTLRDAFAPIEPLTFAGRNRPRRVLMINGSHDEVIPESATTTLWEALDRPPIIWTNAGHFSLPLAWGAVGEATSAFLAGHFGVGPPWAARKILVRPVKVALLWDRRQGLRPGVFKELTCSGERGQVSLDLGMTSNGLYAGAAGVVKDSVALGLGAPIGKGRQRLEPYLSLQLVL